MVPLVPLETFRSANASAASGARRQVQPRDRGRVRQAENLPSIVNRRP
jgi:hypothetical protein